MSFPFSWRCRSLAEMNKDGKAVNWRANTGEVPMKGITSVDAVGLLTLEGASVIGGAEIAERVMGAMASASINVLVVTQARSESSITVVIPEDQGGAALDSLRSAFESSPAPTSTPSASRRFSWPSWSSWGKGCPCRAACPPAS